MTAGGAVEELVAELEASSDSVPTAEMGMCGTSRLKIKYRIKRIGMICSYGYLINVFHRRTFVYLFVNTIP